MTNTASQNHLKARTTFKPDADPNRSGRLSRGLADAAIFSVVALVFVFQVADRVLGRNKASGRLKVI